MDDGQSAITTLDIRREDPQRSHVVDLVKLFLLALHLGPDAIEMFRATTHLTAVEANSSQTITEQLNRDGEALLAFAALG